MSVEITPIHLGFDTCYILKADGVIVVDAGAPNKGSRFLGALEKASIPPEDVSLIVLTHGHWDHIGSARQLKQITKAKIAMHQSEVHWLETPQAPLPLPPGVTAWGRVFIASLKLFMPLIHVSATTVDVTLGDDGLSLHDFGIPGRVIHTPGHSSGSVSVLLDTGEAFVGDLAMSKFPLRLSPGLPIFAEDPDPVVSSWRLLLDEGAARVYPAHGRPFSTDVIRDAIGV